MGDLPLELALLPIVAPMTFAYSHSHAVGLWQLIRTGKSMGHRDRWYDGRRDVITHYGL